MECPDCEGTGYDTWFDGNVKMQDRDVPCSNCGGHGEIEEIIEYKKKLGEEA
ncbi:MULTISPECIES: hypothetical protein [Bacillus amyloliquefaciens group]|nr:MULTISPECIES: hypothetical protein [Bacillus amyloliquefaciens group]QZY10200.1 hypothetical protein K7B13_10450 [Bacillus amyloliquefaciens]QZY11110.1 hypothetical protein K7B13_15450 [Bacillus amyloliquefaciens]